MNLNKPRFLDDKPRHKISSSVDKGKSDHETKSLNFKAKKHSETSNKTTGNSSSSISNTFKETTNRLRKSIKKDSIKLKGKIRGTSGCKKTKSKEPKKRRRPRSNDDRKKEKLAHQFDGITGKRTASRGVSEKSTKEATNSDVLKRRNIVNKFINNAHMLAEEANKIDSRNVCFNNSASLNMKKFIKKKDLNMVYSNKKDMKKKSQPTKLSAYGNSMAKTAEQQFKSFLKNEKQFLVNPYFPGNTGFSKSFGSSIYKPNTTSVTSGKKLTALKNCLVMNNYSNKSTDAKTANYVTTKAMKKIEKKSIKFAMKNQNLSYNEKPSTMLKYSYDKAEELAGGKKKRSVSPITKGLQGKFHSSVNEGMMPSSKSKARSGSRKTNMRSPGGVRIY